MSATDTTCHGPNEKPFEGDMFEMEEFDAAHGRYRRASEAFETAKTDVLKMSNLVDAVVDGMRGPGY
jgi:hypothetical protein